MTTNEQFWESIYQSISAYAEKINSAKQIVSFQQDYFVHWASVYHRVNQWSNKYKTIEEFEDEYKALKLFWLKVKAIELDQEFIAFNTILSLIKDPIIGIMRQLSTGLPEEDEQAFFALLEQAERINE